MLALHVEVAVVTNVELDHHATYGSLAEVREVFRAFLAGVPEAVLWDRPDVLALRAPDAPRVAFDVPDAGARAGRLAVRRGAAPRSRSRCPGAHNARNAAAALEACALAGADAGRGGRGAGRLRGRRAALRAPRHDAVRRRSSSTTTPTTRPRSPRPSTPPGRSARGA